MIMKKRSILFVTAIAALCLTGCDLTQLLSDPFSWIKDSSTDEGKQEGDDKDEEKEVVAKSIEELIGVPREIEQGSTLDIENLSATVLYSDESTKDEAITKIELDTSKVGQVIGKAYVNSLVIEFTINVKAKEEHHEEDAYLTGISISGQSMVYTVDGAFTFDGICKATYSDGTSETVTPTSISKPNMSSVGTATVTISYTENGVTKTATYSISILKNSQESDGYYEGINGNSSTLLNDLNSLNSKKRKSTVGYKNMPSKYTSTDKGTTSGEVTAFYAGTSAKYSGNMNREHVWPNSLGGSSVENDIHMPRPTYSEDNSSRGNEYYVEGKHGPAKPYKETGWDPGAFSDQDASYRGDSARIVFYCCIANTNLKLVDTNGESKPSNTMGKLSDLLKWNLKYPVQQREIDRNDAIETLQGNRNPFIDHPEYACKIWGNYNSATKAICGGNY